MSKLYFSYRRFENIPAVKTGYEAVIQALLQALQADSFQQEVAKLVQPAHKLEATRKLLEMVCKQHEKALAEVFDTDLGIKLDATTEEMQHLLLSLQIQLQMVRRQIPTVKTENLIDKAIDSGTRVARRGFAA